MHARLSDADAHQPALDITEAPLIKERKTQPDSSTPISTIPVEILEEIFFQAIICGQYDPIRFCLLTHSEFFSLPVCKSDDPGTPSPKSFQVREAIVNVCSAWRSLVESSPRLWAVVPVDEGKSQITRALHYSAQIPLVIHVDLGRATYSSSREGASGILPLVFQNLHRVKDLSFRGWKDKDDIVDYMDDYADDGMYDGLTKYQTTSAPLLQRLAITKGRTSYYGENDGSFPFILTQRCPSLRVLVVEGFEFGETIQPNMLPNLEELRFSIETRVQEAHADANSMLSALQAFPLLRMLYLSLDISQANWFSDDWEEYPLPSQPSQPVVLSHLRDLTLKDYALSLLPHLELPSVVTIDLEDRHDTLACSTETHASFIRHMVRTAGVKVVDAISVWPEGISYNEDVSLVITMQATGYRTLDRTGESVSMQFTFKNDCSGEDDSSMARPIIDICRAIQPEVGHTGIRTQLRDLTLSCMLTRPTPGAAVGLARNEDWQDLMHTAPDVEVLHIGGERFGKSFFGALSDDAFDTSSWGFTKLVLRPAFFSEHKSRGPRSEYVERLQSYVTALSNALAARSKRGLLLEELQVDGNGCFVEDDLAPVAAYVGSLKLSNSVDEYNKKHEDPVIIESCELFGRSGGSLSSSAATEATRNAIIQQKSLTSKTKVEDETPMNDAGHSNVGGDIAEWLAKDTKVGLNLAGTPVISSGDAGPAIEAQRSAACRSGEQAVSQKEADGNNSASVCDPPNSGACSQTIPQAKVPQGVNPDERLRTAGRSRLSFFSRLLTRVCKFVKSKRSRRR